MADGYATYFLTHKRGAALNAQRAAGAVETFAQLGDCLVDYPDHHGTPAQRDAAASWAVDLAHDAQKQGMVLPSATFATTFDAALPGILASAS